MKLQAVVMLAFVALTFATTQNPYPDSAVVIGTSRFGFATGEESGNRVSVRDSQGFIHAVYCYNIGGPFADSGEIFYVFSTDNGITWSLPENVSRTDTLTSTEPCIAIDSQDRLHCVWKQLYVDTNTTYYDYDMYYSQNDGSGWTPAVNISNLSLGANGCYSSMVVDSRDWVHVVYDMSTGPGNWDIFYSFYNDTVWSTPYQVSSSPYDDAFPALAIDSNDHLHLIWRQLIADGVIYYSYYDGNSWTGSEIIFSIPGGHAGYPCIVADSQNYPRVLCACALPAESGDIYYTAYNGVSWSTPLNLSNTVNPSGYSSLAIDSLDHLYVVWMEETSIPDYEVYYRTYNGAVWSDTVNITRDSGFSFCPKLGNPITGSKVDLVWTNFRSFSPETYDIIYLGLNTTGVIEQDCRRPDRVDWYVAPNPFRKSTTLNYNLAVSIPVKVMIYDVSGRTVAEIKPYQSPTNHHRVTWSAGDLPSGVYFISVQGGDCSMVKKVIKLE